MKEETREKLKAIKQGFRLMMNGEASRSMREKGVEYHLNWGVSLQDLQQVAQEYGKDYELAVELWKEDIRECKILATMIMPVEKMEADLTDLWMEQTTQLEIAEMAAFNLYQHLPYAPAVAYRWIASDNVLEQVCGYHVLSRLFMRKIEPNDRGSNEFVDQALTALQGDSMPVRHAAMTCIRRFASLGDEYELMAQNALKSIHLELF